MVGDEDLDEKEVCSKRMSKETYRRMEKKKS